MNTVTFNLKGLGQNRVLGEYNHPVISLGRVLSFISDPKSHLAPSNKRDQIKIDLDTISDDAVLESIADLSAAHIFTTINRNTQKALYDDCGKMLGLIHQRDEKDPERQKLDILFLVTHDGREIGNDTSIKAIMPKAPLPFDQHFEPLALLVHLSAKVDRKEKLSENEYYASLEGLLAFKKQLNSYLSKRPSTRISQELRVSTATAMCREGR
jgi:hypothetical protein